MPIGRPKIADAGTVYSFAHQFYWDFRRIQEGYSRWKYDQEEYERAIREVDAYNLGLSESQKVALVQVVRKDVEAGRLAPAEKMSRLRELGIANLAATREWLKVEVGELVRTQIKVPGKPEVIEALLNAETSEAVQNICTDAVASRTVEVRPGVKKELTIPNWPIPAGSVLPMYLAENAAQFIAAKNDPRFPKSTTRPSSKLKQLWFLSRALAGALYGISVRTSINLVGSKRPDEMFEESRAGKSIRKRRGSRGK